MDYIVTSCNKWRFPRWCNTQHDLIYSWLTILKCCEWGQQYYGNFFLALTHILSHPCITIWVTMWQKFHLDFNNQGSSLRGVRSMVLWKVTLCFTSILSLQTLIIRFPYLLCGISIKCWGCISNATWVLLERCLRQIYMGMAWLRWRIYLIWYPGSTWWKPPCHAPVQDTQSGAQPTAILSAILKGQDSAGLIECSTRL